MSAKTRITRPALRTAAVGIAILATGALAAAAPPAPGSATGSIAAGGKPVALTHAIAFNEGAVIYVLITDQALPPDQVKSEFQLGMYEFQHHVVGLELLLDSERKVKSTSYLWEQAKKPCSGCLEVSISGGADGPLTGTIKSTAKGLQTDKLQVDSSFSAPFARSAGGKK